MAASTKAPVLIIGGSGVVGAQAARTLRNLHPDLPITIGGRNMAKADTVAEGLGNADSASIDLNRPDLGLPADRAFSAVAMFLKDETLNSMRFAQARGLPYLSISSWVLEIGPEVVSYVHRPHAAPILMGSSWLVGAAILPALGMARDYRRIDRIDIAAILDEQDMGGPAAYADFERMTGVASQTLVRKQGQWVWAGGEEGKRVIHSVDGTPLDAEAYTPLDVLSLATITDAPSIRFDIVIGESSSRRRGEAYSTEIIIELHGERHDGSAAAERLEIVHPAGQAPLTALGVAVSIERLLGLAGGEAVKPGLHLVETLIDPSYMVQRMKDIGARFERKPL